MGSPVKYDHCIVVPDIFYVIDDVAVASGQVVAITGSTATVQGKTRYEVAPMNDAYNQYDAVGVAFNPVSATLKDRNLGVVVHGVVELTSNGTIACNQCVMGHLSAAATTSIAGRILALSAGANDYRNKLGRALEAITSGGTGRIILTR